MTLAALLSGWVLVLYANVLMAGGRTMRDFATVRAATGCPEEWWAALAFLGLAGGLGLVVDAMLRLEAPAAP